MNRNFENKAVIKALNMYGRVPETWELLKEIERLNNIIKELDRESYLGMLENKNNNDYLKGRDEIGCLDIYQVDELLDILNEVSE